MIKVLKRKAYELADRVSLPPLTRNVGWLTGAELVSRLGRILAAVILARQLDAAAFGIAAIALTLFELVRVFTENGIGAAVIRACDDTVERVSNTAYKMMWIVCVGLACIQICAGLIIEQLVPGKQLGLMIAALSLVFLIMPFGVVHAFRLIREQRMKRLAAVNSSQAVADHLLTAVLALAGAGAWAIVLPKLLTAPIWLIGVCYDRPWNRDRAVGAASTHEILKFSLPVLGAELLTVARDQLDKVIVSLVLGVEALGLYYFAFNAGLGVSTALNRAFSNALYPHLCAASDKLKAYRKTVLTLGLPLCLAYFAQAAAALLYVPIVFGERWASAAILVSILCLGGPARLLIDGVRMYHRSAGASSKELITTIGLASIVLIPFSAAIGWGLMPAVIASICGASLYALVLTAAMLHRAKGPLPNMQLQGASS